MNYRNWDNARPLAELVGKTLTRAQHFNAEGDDERIEFETADGDLYVMFHQQDCCESVRVESFVGDLQDLVGEPILRAEESASDTHPEGHVAGPYEESFTWTFYKLATRKGYVDIRWLGESNGYYSEGVDFAIDNPRAQTATQPADQQEKTR